MNDLERRALLGDAEAQRECTEKGIVLPCPFCGNEPITEDNRVFCGACGLAYEELDAGLSLRAWNTRPAPPIGRCASCACRDENTCECVAAADIEVAYHRYTEPDFFCGDFKPKGGEENG